MKRYFIKEYLSLIILIILLAALFPAISSADLELQYPPQLFGGIQIGLGMDINQLVRGFYYFIITIAGIAAFVMIVWGGFRYFTSGGNPVVINEAKDRIFSAFLGLIIILASWLILNTINPELVFLNPPKLPEIGGVEERGGGEEAVEGALETIEDIEERIERGLPIP